ncbi:MAG: YihY/virulence factor BrkB family protein [Deltaproteobacteria bacterium]|nr:YihY/virulence factor BrkB family protein [Deltaproteobacteria bacterium]
MSPRNPFRIILATCNGFLQGDGLTMAAAISFYAALSVSPILILLFWAAHNFGISDEEQIFSQLGSFAGPQASDLARAVLSNIESRPNLGNVAGVLGFSILILSAAGVFSQLRVALNRIWNVESRPHFSLLHWIQKRFIAMLMVFVLAVLIPASLLSTSIIALFTSYLGRQSWSPLLLETLNASLSLLLFSIFFSLLFRYLPDAAPRWKFIRPGAAITALLFTLGKTLIGMYLGFSTVSSVFGAAGSLAVFLIWVYYSAAIFLFGAELTQQISLAVEGAETKPE